MLCECGLSPKISYKCNNAFSILTRHLPHTAAMWYLCNLKWDSKLSTDSFFLVYSFTDRRSFLLWILATSAYDFFSLALLSWEHSPFHLKEALHSFSLVYLNIQHLSSCTLAPLLNKVRITWLQALQHQDRGSNYRVGYWVSNRQDLSDKGMIDGSGGCRIASHFSKLRNCLFPEVSI